MQSLLRPSLVSRLLALPTRSPLVRIPLAGHTRAVHGQTHGVNHGHAHAHIHGSAVSARAATEAVSEHTHPVAPEVAINPATGAHVHQLHLPFKTRLTVEDIRKKKGFIIDMDGVMYHGKSLLPGAQRFVRWLQETKKDFLFLTNSSERSPRELKEKLSRLGIQVDAHHFYTSALATAVFLSSQQPNGSCYVIGEPGLISALYDAGFSMNEVNPDFVVVGETRNYTYERIEHAVHLVRQGARLIGTNVDVTDKMHGSFVPACGSLIKPIEMASGRQAYFVGKPNPLIMRNAMRHMNANRGDTVILGDRMDTDILGGIQSEIDATLVLSGVTTIADVGTYSYRPDCVLEGVGSLPPADFK